MKLKLFLLGGIFALVGIFNFSNAETINVSCPFQEECTPNQINISSDNCIDGVSQISLNNISCVLNENSDSEDTSCGLNFSSDEGSWYNITYEDGQIVDNSCYIQGDDTLFYVNSGNPEMDMSASINLPGGNEGGNEGGSNGSSSSIIPGGSDGLTPAIDGLRGVVYEIIPYVIYIGIGVLISILGFYAIRWLVNWLGGKINSYFSSKRD